MMKLVRYLFIALLLGTFASAGAAAAASPKIGIIDTQRILKESKAAQEARSEIMEDLRAKQSLYQAKEKEILRMREDYARDKDRLSPEEAKDRQTDLAKSLKELTRLKADLEEELNRKNRELTRDILREIMEVVREFREEEKFTLILEKGNTVSWDEDIDITGDILDLYDKARK